MNFTLQFRLSIFIFVLALIASSTGLFSPSVYRETSWVIPQNRGQDLVTLLSLFIFAPISIRANQGSLRAYLIWLGLVGYLCYTYTGAAFAYGFNELFPVYLALFSLTGTSLIVGLTTASRYVHSAAFSKQTPRVVVAVFLFTMAGMLATMWISQIAGFYLTGELPERIGNSTA